MFDVLDWREMQRSRARCNPFETLGKLFFQNRAALKMANMDAVFDFMFTRPKNEAGVRDWQGQGGGWAFREVHRK